MLWYLLEAIPKKCEDCGFDVDVLLHDKEDAEYLKTTLESMFDTHRFIVHTFRCRECPLLKIGRGYLEQGVA